MIRKHDFEWKDLATVKAAALIWGPILLVTVLHYSTGATHSWLHDIFRRMYYLPIVMAAFAFGLRGSLVASAAAALLYAPHAFTRFVVHDPARGTEKLLEIVLYFIIGIVAGVLADREYAERKKQEETATLLRKTLDEKNLMEKMLVRAGRLQALGELTAGLAHEIKNPLASISGAAESVIDELAPDSPRQKMAAVLRRELDRLAKILERFLSFARPEEYDLTEISLSDQVDQVGQFLGAQARQKGVVIIVAASEKNVLVFGEKEKISQVLMNLLLNALQASDEGGEVRLSCDYARRNHKTYGRIIVEDDGPGVPEENRDRVFNPFFTTRDHGSGLGLSIASRIVDQHHGFIEISESGSGGARFEVYLPVAQNGN